MAKNKTRTLTDAELRQVEILKKYHEVDEEKQIVHVKLRYESVNELLSQDESTEEKPVINREIIERIDDIISVFPKGFKLDLDIQIDDYENYSHEKIMESFTDIYELEFYRTDNQNKKMWLVAAALLFIGCFLLILLNILQTTGALGDSLSDRVLDYFLDTVACVFMWECVSQLFLYPAEFVVRNTRVNYTLQSIKLIDKKNKVLDYRDAEFFAKNFVHDTKKVKAAKAILLSVGTIHIILAVISIANFICEINKVSFDNVQFILYTVSICLVALFEIIYGVGSINSFLGRPRFRKWIMPMSWLLLLLYAFHIVCVVFAWMSGKTIAASILTSAVIGIIVTVANMVGYHILKKNKKFNSGKVNK